MFHCQMAVSGPYTLVVPPSMDAHARTMSPSERLTDAVAVVTPPESGERLPAERTVNDPSPPALYSNPEVISESSVSELT